MGTSTASPGAFSADFARYLKLSKREWLDASNPGEVMQLGGAYVGGRIEIPQVDGPGGEDEPQIETFLIDSDGSCTATGTNAHLIARFLPAVREMAERVLKALAEFEVVVESPAYVTVSTTPHLDDDQYIEGAGVGVVAIAANGAGPQIACSPLSHGPVRHGLPLTLDPAAADQFESGDIPAHQVDANRVVLFAQFGQLHSGPVAVETPELSARSLLVFRAATTPS